MAKKTTTKGAKTTAPKTTAPKTTKAGRTPKDNATTSPKRAKQVEVPGARPNADAEIDRIAGELDDHRTARMQAGHKETDAKKRLLETALRKGLVKLGGTLRYPLADGDTLVIRPKSDELGVYFEKPEENEENTRRQTKLSIVEDGLSSTDEELPF